MKSNRLKNSITCLLLVIFISMKMAGLHTLSHIDDTSPSLGCTTCDYIISHNLTPTLLLNIIDYTFEAIKYSLQIKKSGNYNFLISNTIAANQLFSRPPPFVIIRVSC